MSFDVRLVLTIYSENRKQLVSLHKDIQLPFVPFEGLGLSVTTRPIRRVSWDLEGSRFTCHIEDQEFSVEGDLIDLEFLAKQAIEDGWSGSGRILQIPN
ncbi:hypothetical protein G3465_21115 [Shewanella baltica]|uniref:hypothetical protein n=1 Tax=Shewanella baltica TaxID=62322 RepID=UPI00217EAC99|nr:hypothetical protein [Shewanella baltica]MCS6155347.1 hypothetical protein [Shewanella baltica]